MNDYLGALRNPRYIRAFLRDCVVMMRRAGLATAAGYACERLFGFNPQVAWRHRRGRSPTVSVGVSAFAGSVMQVNLADAGISRDLILHGAREDAAAAFFRSVLQPGQTVVDAGANICWYVLLEAPVIGSQGRILAVEPAPSNFELLQRNIELNGFSDRVTAVRAAVAGSTGAVSLHLARRSNLHTVTRTPIMDSYVEFDGQVDVPAFTMDELVTMHGLEPRDIDVIRMDVEGFEVEVLAGMKRVLAESEDLLMFIEIHPKIIREVRGDEGYHSFIDGLAAHGFRIAAAAESLSSRLDRETTLCFADLKDGHEAIELLLVRGHNRMAVR